MSQKLFIILISLCGVCFAQNAETNQSAFNRELRQIVFNISKATSPSKISRATLNKLVDLYYRYDNMQGKGSESAFPTQNEERILYSAFDNLVVAAKKDTSFIRALINLQSCIRTNAELGESMPCYVQSAVCTNTVGFLKMYQRMNEHERNNLNSALDWPCDKIDLKKFLNNAALNLKDKHLKALAIQIADSLHEEK